MSTTHPSRLRSDDTMCLTPRCITRFIILVPAIFETRSAFFEAIPQQLYGGMYANTRVELRLDYIIGLYCRCFRCLNVSMKNSRVFREM